MYNFLFSGIIYDGFHKFLLLVDTLIDGKLHRNITLILVEGLPGYIKLCLALLFIWLYGL